MSIDAWTLRTSFVAGVTAALAALAAGCASGPAATALDPVVAQTSSAIIFDRGDDVLRAAIVRVVLGGDSRLLESRLEAGAFNDVISDSEAATFLAVAQRTPVVGGVSARDPARGARRLIYAMLAARVVARGTWSELDEWFTAAGTDQDHRNDITAGFAVTDWWPEGSVAAPRTDEELRAWRAVVARVIAGTTDGMAKRRLVGNACGKLGLLPRSRSEPEPTRRDGAAYIRQLLAVEIDDGTRAALHRALALTGWAELAPGQ